MIDLEKFLDKKWLTAVDQRPPLQHDKDHPFVKMINKLETLTKNNEKTSVVFPKLELAFKFMRLFSIFNPEAASIPLDIRESVNALLSIQVAEIVNATKGSSVNPNALRDALQRILSFALAAGYLYRSLEVDGRWTQVENQSAVVDKTDEN